MPNEFIARRGLISLASSQITGSLGVTGGITGSLLGTASLATTASYSVTSSVSVTASYASSAKVFPFTGSATISGSLGITGSIGLNTLPNVITSNAIYYNTTDGTLSYGSAGGGSAFPYVGTAAITGSVQVVNTAAVIMSTGSSLNFLSQSLSQSANIGATIYALTVAPIFTNTANSQTQTALRVNPTFTGSFSSSATNNIVDFGTTTLGSQFIVNDVISGSIYTVNDSVGIQIIEATSDWVVNLYEGPNNVVFKKSGSAVYTTGSLQGTASYAITSSYANVAASIAGGVSAFPYTGIAVISGSIQIVTSGSTATVVSTGSSANYISQSLAQSANIGAVIYGLTVAPTFTNTTSSQTQTALRVNPTFTGSFSSSATNNIVDFGTTTLGSQFIINDITSGSIYLVNDSVGIPIIEATSDWVVNLYEGPNNVIFQKSGSTILIAGSLNLSTGSTFTLPITSSVVTSKPTGSAYFSNNFLYIWNGIKYVSSSFS